MKHGYIQQVYAPKSSYSEILERKSKINRLVTNHCNAYIVPKIEIKSAYWIILCYVCRSGVELPTSLSGDDETDESSSSSMD